MEPRRGTCPNVHNFVHTPPPPAARPHARCGSEPCSAPLLCSCYCGRCAAAAADWTRADPATRLACRAGAKLHNWRCHPLFFLAVVVTRGPRTKAVAAGTVLAGGERETSGVNGRQTRRDRREGEGEVDSCRKHPSSHPLRPLSLLPAPPPTSPQNPQGLFFWLWFRRSVCCRLPLSQCLEPVAATSHMVFVGGVTVL